MASDIVFSSEHILITRNLDDFFIESFRNGMTMPQFNNIMDEHPEIKITSFIAVKNALLFPPSPPAKFGEMRERVSVEISNDELRAYITLCVRQNELEDDKKSALIKEVIRKLNEKGVIYGIKHDVLLNNLCNNKQILIAEGDAPVNGEDSRIRMYELKEAKPETKEDGNVDHYELDLIDKVGPGDWLGERVEPTQGIPGKSVKGNTIEPVPGRVFPLLYDKKTVREIYENGVTTLYATCNGAVNYNGDRISVSNLLEIGENVDFKTGNIDFEGFLTVKGTIDDNFSVAADKDIEVLGAYGVGSVKEIVSREGSIYIKGGIAGKNRAIVKSNRDIYTKFVSDATIICEGSVHIGFYCLNSNITAKEVILDSPKGKIIGGQIDAEIKVVSSIIGTPSEKRTVISVKGFDRKALKEKIEMLTQKTEILRNEMTKAKQQMSTYTNTSNLTRERADEYERIKEIYFKLKDALKILDDERKALTNYKRTKGEGEISILKRAYPNTLIEIKGISKELNTEVLTTSYYIQDGELKEI